MNFERLIVSYKKNQREYKLMKTIKKKFRQKMFKLMMVNIYKLRGISCDKYHRHRTCKVYFMITNFNICREREIM
jgi:hypothetical protein